MKWNDLRSLFLLFILTDCVFSFLDLTELSSFQYSIDISNQPVLLDETKDKEGILLSSKHGQKYQCQFESLSKFSQKVRDEEENASKMSVTELLETMKAKPCLTLTTGWWTYEFCYKGQIKQYHMTDQKVLGDVLHLGSYLDEFDWDANHDKKAPEIRNRFHSQQYVNGSVCDLTGTMRSAEVRFKCKEDTPDAIEGVEEPSTCRYLVHITTPHLCRHPSLRSVPDKKSLPITCNPVLDVADYNDYVELQARLKEEREKGLVEGGKSDSSGSDLDKINTDLDGEFGYIEIGNTKVKFYVLNIDPTNSEDANKDEKSASIESSTSDKEIVASSTSLIATSESTESSSSSSTTSPSSSSTSSSTSSTSSTSSSSATASTSSSTTTTSSTSSSSSPTSAIDKSDGADAIVSSEDAIPDDFFGDDTKEFLEIYKRLLSNKKLKSFINKEREAIKNVGQEKSTEDDRSIVEETPVEGEGSTQTTQSGEKEIGDEPGVGGEKVVEKKMSDDVVDENSVEVSEVGEKSVEPSERSKGEGHDVRAEDEVSETETKNSKEISSKEGDDDDDDESKVDESGTKIDKKVTKLKIDQRVAGDLFKNENQFPEEHKNIHQMIMDIIRQSDRNTKEVIRHDDMSKNYDFDWKKEKKRNSKIKKSEERLKDEL